ncbi:MAG: rhodanese-like domain-containing protein [Gammaproteobacteria bacterium]
MERFIEFILNHYVYSLALAVVTYLLIQEFIDAAFKKFGKITPLNAVTKMNESDAIIIDVREAADFSESHIEQAINAPLSKLGDYLAKLSDHKNKPVLVACQNGTRSLSAAKLLTKEGFEQVFVINGGMQAWEEDYKLPVKLNKKNKNKA